MIGVLGPRHLGIQIVHNLETPPSPVVYRAKFGRSISNRMAVGKGVLKTLWTLGPHSVGMERGMQRWHMGYGNPRGSPYYAWGGYMLSGVCLLVTVVLRHKRLWRTYELY